MTSCAQCGAELETLVGCGACGALGTLAASPDPFELFGLEPGWAVDRADLKKRLLRFSRITHPDFFAAGAAEVRERAERNSAELNAAYEILSDDFRRADHLVKRLGGPDEQQERQMPQAFLMEVLEWNETLEEARESGSADDLAGLASTLESEREDAFEQVAAALTPLPTAGSDALAAVRKLLNAVRYVDRALSEIRALRLQSPPVR